MVIARVEERGTVVVEGKLVKGSNIHVHISIHTNPRAAPPPSSSHLTPLIHQTAPAPIHIHIPHSHTKAPSPAASEDSTGSQGREETILLRPSRPPFPKQGTVQMQTGKTHGKSRDPSQSTGTVCLLPRLLSPLVKESGHSFSQSVSRFTCKLAR